jgi:C-terminal processing protease CtpA/Prc
MRSVIRTAAFVTLGLAAGFAISIWTQRGAAPASFDAYVDGGGLESRISALESALRRESQQRAVLAAEIDELRGRLAAATAEAPLVGAPLMAAASPTVDAAADAPADAPAAESPADRRERVIGRFRNAATDPDQFRLDRLLEAGFSPDRADWINRRTAQLRMQALEEEYRAARGEEPAAPSGGRSADAALRAELGEQDYERYLRAVGRPTSIGVRSVLASSPAEQAGLLPGDEVVAYGGQRVFDTADLNRLTLQGQPGESIALDVVRDGQQIQLYVPRGPIGIMSGGRFGRRP